MVGEMASPGINKSLDSRKQNTEIKMLLAASVWAMAVVVLLEVVGRDGAVDRNISTHDTHTTQATGIWTNTETTYKRYDQGSGDRTKRTGRDLRLHGTADKGAEARLTDNTEEQVLCLCFRRFMQPISDAHYRWRTRASENELISASLRHCVERIRSFGK